MGEERHKTFTKKRIALCAAVVLCAAVIGLLVADHDSTPMPVYQGKTAREWLNEVSAMNTREPIDAFRQMGSNAVPFLVHEMRGRESLWQKVCGWIYPKLPKNVSSRLSWPAPSGQRLRDGAIALRYVHSRTAVPPMLTLVMEGNSDQQFYALTVLDPLLEETDTNWVPQLMTCLKSDESGNRLYATHILVKLHSGELAIPALTNLVDSENMLYSMDASHLLERIDSNNATK